MQVAAILIMLAFTGCVSAFGAPVHDHTAAAECPSYAWPIVDTIIATAEAGGSIAGARQYSGPIAPDIQTLIGVTAIAGVAAAISAVYGYAEIGACRTRRQGL